MTAAASRPSATVAAVLARLKGVQPRAGGWMAKCPAHDDRQQSLAIAVGADGRALLTCHAGCPLDAIVGAAGLTLADLFPPKETALKVERGGQARARIVREYDYVDEDGRLLYQVCRTDPKSGFPQRRPDPERPGKWIWNLKGVRLVLYHLPQLLAGVAAGRVVFVVEGEKDVESLEAHGFVATTHSGGAGKWQPVHAEPLRGARVVLLPDHDAPGREHMQQVAASLEGVATWVRCVELPGLEAKEDVSDWFARRGGTAAQLQRLVAAAPLYALPRVRADQPPSPPAMDDDTRERNTDLGNARRLVRLHQEDLRHVAGWGWVAWDGTHWRRDDTGEVMRRAKDTVRAMYGEARDTEDFSTRTALVTWARKSEDASRLAAMVRLAASEEAVACRPDVFDADPLLFNVRNGTIDLRTGALRPHAKGDLITRCAPVAYDADAACPRWRAFLDRIFSGDQELIAFVQRAAGYLLTGSTAEHVLFFCIGTGANGKSVLLEVLRAILGPYAAQADFSTFLERRNDGPRNDLARLAGARMVSASESDEGKRLAEGTVKLLSGGDTIVARFLNQEHFEFTPQFKVLLVSNHKPRITGTDEGIWRRIRLVPFRVTIPPEERDPQLKAKLLEELPGILAWAVEGCRAWMAHGLGTAEPVATATASYRAESDDLAEFFALHCEFHPTYAVASSALYERYAAWAGKGAKSPTSFGRTLTDRGFLPERRGRGSDRTMWRIGLRLATDEPHPDDERDGAIIIVPPNAGSGEGSTVGRVGESSGGISSLTPSTRTITPTTLPTLPNPPRTVDLFGIREAEVEEQEEVRQEEEREDFTW